MREWLSGGAPPCQGGGRGFDPRLALLKKDIRLDVLFYFVYSLHLYHGRSTFKRHILKIPDLIQCCLFMINPPYIAFYFLFVLSPDYQKANKKRTEFLLFFIVNHICFHHTLKTEH